MRSTRLAAALLALGLALGACSGPKDPSADDREDISSALQSGDTGLTEAQADCFAEVVVEEVDAKVINDIDFDAEEPSAEVADQLGAAAVQARTECEIEAR